MTPQELQWLQRNTMALEAIRDILQSIRLQLMQDRPPPDYQYDLLAFQGFDWSSIGATVLECDRYGVQLLCHGLVTPTPSVRLKISSAMLFGSAAALAEGIMG